MDNDDYLEFAKEVIDLYEKGDIGKMGELINSVRLKAQKEPSADVPLQCRVMCASCRKECSQDGLHEVKGTTTLSNYTMTFQVCDECDPQDVKTEKPT